MRALAAALIAILMLPAMAMSSETKPRRVITPDQCIAKRLNEHYQKADSIRRWVEEEMLRLYAGRPLCLPIKSQYGDYYSQNFRDEYYDENDFASSIFTPKEDDFVRAAELLATDGWTAEFIDDPRLEEEAEKNFQLQIKCWNGMGTKGQQNHPNLVPEKVLIHHSLFKVGAKK